jgi:rod shape-determining protein MreB
MADLAIDLGTSSVRIVLRGRGVVLEAPTAVASHAGPRGREVVAVGEDAKKMLGRTPAGTEVIRPVRGGVVADFEATEQLLRELLRRAGTRTLLKPRILVCIPSTHTEVERRAVQESTRAAGGRDILLVSTSMAAALGADLPVDRPVGSMVVDVGGGRTEAAVISLGGTVVCRSAPVAGEAMDEAIGAWLKRRHGLLIGERTAEGIKLRTGCATALAPPLYTRIRGRDLTEGAPREIDLTSDDVREAIAEPVSRIRDVVLAVLGAAPAELAADIVDRGIILCGGGSRLRGLDRVLGEATGLPVLQADTPHHCVAVGAGRLLEDEALFARVVIPA